MSKKKKKKDKTGGDYRNRGHEAFPGREQSDMKLFQVYDYLNDRDIPIRAASFQQAVRG
jgi:hypothetical protein